VRCGRGRGRERHIIEEHMWWAYKGKNPTWCLSWLGLSKKDCFFQKIVWMGQPKGGRTEACLQPVTQMIHKIVYTTTICMYHVPCAHCHQPQTSKHTDRRKLETQSNGSCNKQSNVISKNQVACSPLPSSPPQSAARDRRRQSSKRGGKGN